MLTLLIWKSGEERDQQLSIVWNWKLYFIFKTSRYSLFSKANYLLWIRDKSAMLGSTNEHPPRLTCSVFADCRHPDITVNVHPLAVLPKWNTPSLRTWRLVLIPVGESNWPVVYPVKVTRILQQKGTYQFESENYWIQYRYIYLYIEYRRDTILFWNYCVHIIRAHRHLITYLHEWTPIYCSLKRFGLKIRVSNGIVAAYFFRTPHKFENLKACITKL